MGGKGLGCGVKHEAGTFTLPVSGDGVRPGQQRCRGAGIAARRQGLGKRVWRSEEQHQRKRHKEVVGGGGRMGTKRHEGRERWGMAVRWEFFGVLLCLQ